MNEAGASMKLAWICESIVHDRARILQSKKSLIEDEEDEDEDRTQGPPT